MKYTASVQETAQSGKPENIDDRDNVEGSVGGKRFVKTGRVISSPFFRRFELGYNPAPRSDRKKLVKLERIKTKSRGHSALSQGLVFLKVALCRQEIFIFVSRSGSVWVFSRCLQVFSYFLKVTQSFLKVDRQTQGTGCVFTPWEIWRSNAISSVSAFSRPCRKNVCFSMCNPCLMVFWHSEKSQDPKPYQRQYVSQGQTP